MASFPTHPNGTKKLEKIMIAEGKSPLTITAYLAVAKKVAGKTINQELINELLQPNNKGQSPSNTTRAAIKYLLQHRKQTVSSKKNEAKYYIPTKKKNPPDVHNHTINEIKALINEMQPREALITKIMYAGGLRIHEALNLKKKDVDFIDGRFTGTGKGNKPFWYELPQETLTELKKYVQQQNTQDNDLLFKYECKNPRRSFYYYFKKAAKKAFPGRVLKTFHPHSIRHSAGTNFNNIPGITLIDTQVFLRHADVSTTQRYAASKNEQLIKETAKENLRF